MEKLEYVQYSAVLASSNWHLEGTSHEKLYNKLGWKSLNVQQWSRCLILFYTVVNDLAPDYTRNPKICHLSGIEQTVCVPLPKKDKNDVPLEDKPYVRRTDLNIKKQQEIPFVIYADFESLLEKVDGDESCKTAYQKHTLISYCWYVKSIDKRWTREPTIYTGLDCMEHFMCDMDKLNNEIRTAFRKIMKLIPMTDDERLQ